MVVGVGADRRSVLPLPIFGRAVQMQARDQRCEKAFGVLAHCWHAFQGTPLLVYQLRFLAEVVDLAQQSVLGAWLPQLRVSGITPSSLPRLTFSATCGYSDDGNLSGGWAIFEHVIFAHSEHAVPQRFSRTLVTRAVRLRVAADWRVGWAADGRVSAPDQGEIACPGCQRGWVRVWV